jgi:type III secretion system YscQ/HrcQ family protein
MAHKCRSIFVPLGDEASGYNIMLLATPVLKNKLTFGILFEIEGIPVPVWFSAWPLEQRIKEFIDDGDITKAPVDLRAELVERALKPLLDPIINKTKTTIHVMNFLTHQPSQVNDMSIGFEFTDESNHDISILVVVHEKVTTQLLKMMSYWPSRRLYPWQHHLTTLCLEVGRVDLSLQQLAKVSLADIILLEGNDVERNGVLLRNGAGHVYRAVVTDKQLVLESGIITMSDDIQNEVLDSINDIPVRLSFDVGEVILSFDAVQKLTQGSVVDLNYPITPMVTIRSNNKVIGTGELVDIDGKKGVRISQLFSMGNTDAVANKEGSNG